MTGEGYEPWTVEVSNYITYFTKELNDGALKLGIVYFKEQR